MKKAFVLLATIWLAALVGLPAAAEAGKKLKVYISVDIEGIGGVVTRDQTSPEGWEYQQARKWMTAEANAAIQGAFDAGATEVLVSDAHGNAQSLILDEVDKRVRLIRGWPRKLIMMEGIDDSFDTVLFIGYHASEGMRHATLAHTMWGTRIFDIYLNGQKVPEAGFNAALAGHFGVPVVLISGDQTVIAETRRLVGDVEGAEVKTGIGTVAQMMHPEKAQELIREKTKAALGRLRDAEIAGFLPGVGVVDGRTIQYTGHDMVEISGLLAALLGL